MADIKFTQDAAFDLQSLSTLKNQVQRSPQAGLRAVAQQMEGLFVQMMMKSMREALPGGSMLDNDQSRLYTSMYDQQLSQDLSKKGLGFADVIVRQLGGKVEPEQAVQRVATPESPLTLNPAAVHAQGERRLEHMLEQALPDFAGRGANASRTGPVRENASFVQSLAGPAQEAVKESGLSHHVVLALAALESGWGKREIPTHEGRPSHNLFGIKAGSSWKGKSTEITTTEYIDGVAHKVRARFRVYDSYKQAMQDYVQLLNSSPRYRSVMQADTAEQAAKELQKAGYATDPHYAKKLINVMKQIKTIGEKVVEEGKQAITSYQTDLSQIF